MNSSVLLSAVAEGTVDLGEKWRLDLCVLPVRPLKPIPRLFLIITELPSIILWAYAVYWLEVCCLVGVRAPGNVWCSAVVAGLLVGLGLNANASRALRKPLSRTRKKQIERKKALRDQQGGGSQFFIKQWINDFVQQTQHMEFTPSPRASGCTSQFPSQTADRFLPPSSAAISLNFPTPATNDLPLCWSENETIIDYGMIIRFFLIPFGVSSLSGLTNTMRDDFILVFPRDQKRLVLFLVLPSTIVCLLYLIRLYVVLKLRIKPSLRLIFFNGKLCL